MTEKKKSWKTHPITSIIAGAILLWLVWANFGEALGFGGNALPGATDKTVTQGVEKLAHERLAEAGQTVQREKIQFFKNSTCTELKDQRKIKCTGEMFIDEDLYEIEYEAWYDKADELFVGVRVVKEIH